MVIHVFKLEYVVGYAVLVVTAISMAITYHWGYIVFCIEFIMILVINREFVNECYEMVKRIFLKIKRKRI